MKSQIVIPARNEAGSVGQLVRLISEKFDGIGRIIVVDNGSVDQTKTEALEAGAKVLVQEYQVGKGFAVCAGLVAADPGPVFVCDADVEGITSLMLRQLEAAHDASSSPVVRLAIGRSATSAPVTTLVARPLLGVLGYSEPDVMEPIGGLVLVDRDFVLQQHLPGGWGFDIALTMRVLQRGLRLPEVSAAGVSHRERPLEDYVGMSREVLRAALIAAGVSPWDHEDCIRCRR